MRVWIVFLLCLAGKALAAPAEEEPVIDEVEIGSNPVQVETGEFDEAIEVVEDVAAENPCLNHHCKKGKVCELDDNNEPLCVCQDPLTCSAPAGEFEHVCGTDNKTYDSSCHFFATKCALEGTKKGHKLHLDYIGPCKFIAPCMENELGEFPLRMRDWLKNVMVTLYERDEENNLLNEKQKLRVKKIFENEKRLQAGEHSLDLLALDFEKNYNMYIFPVHWQFGQLDQHPSDGFLSHTELSPLRAPLQKQPTLLTPAGSYNISFCGITPLGSAACNNQVCACSDKVDLAFCPGLSHPHRDVPIAACLHSAILAYIKTSRPH